MASSPAGHCPPALSPVQRVRPARDDLNLVRTDLKSLSDAVARHEDAYEHLEESSASCPAAHRHSTGRISTIPGPFDVNPSAIGRTEQPASTARHRAPLRARLKIALEGRFPLRSSPGTTSAASLARALRPAAAQRLALWN
ncbi:hypothetical protein C8T65DRAFT_742385 [Cerioporus squamosus]|nr:hypothetical protein C8T65DRAFT_742379 [Cerioporus squamosus]KAI0699766.1 hypothetical protein C8T65DRAFT_742385 [Cerioporus squamosus]